MVWWRTNKRNGTPVAELLEAAGAELRHIVRHYGLRRTMLAEDLRRDSQDVGCRCRNYRHLKKELTKMRTPASGESLSPGELGSRTPASGESLSPGASIACILQHRCGMLLNSIAVVLHNLAVTIMTRRWS
ncbi:hypothetical protein CSKR_113308 [Clonorchis sinensis]|uniref:Uncharacterized protein n=1 Tax=Clonorchis sinensis TaxID=79923 RepID=A0A419PRU2_CLOSI|nr:hypothetical protein CSKR_113308 [Clonorchis sinensis]